jgi:protein phosphatase 1 regulatory subunit 11
MSNTRTTTVTKRLKLRLVRERRRVTWAEGTIDNEHLGRKKSKICCIYCSKNRNRNINKYERP